MKNNFFYQFFRILLTPIFKLYYNVKIVNKEVIPKNGAFIICGNHLNAFDQFPVIASTKRTIHWLSKKEYFEGNLKWFFKATKCICVDRSSHDGMAKEEAINYLKKEKQLDYFQKEREIKQKRIY